MTAAVRCDSKARSSPSSEDTSFGGSGSLSWLPEVSTQVFHVPASGSTGWAQILLVISIASRDARIGTTLAWRPLGHLIELCFRISSFPCLQLVQDFSAFITTSEFFQWNSGRPGLPRRPLRENERGRHPTTGTRFGSKPFAYAQLPPE